VLARFSEHGPLDDTFGAGGMVRTSVSIVDGSFGGYGADVKGAALQADGKILVVATVYGSIGNTQAYARGFLLRYDADGNLDSTFGAGGVVVAHPSEPEVYSYSSAVAVQPDGKIKMLSAYLYIYGTPSSIGTLTRYDEQGNLDLTFGDHGVAPSITVSQPDLAFSPALFSSTPLIVDDVGRPVTAGAVLAYSTSEFLGYGLARTRPAEHSMSPSAPTRPESRDLRGAFRRTTWSRPAAG
jgi:hypothetical protein